MTTPFQASNGDQVDLPTAREFHAELTPELIRYVADKVYALLMRELQIEQERLRIRSRISQTTNLHR